jgi:hypothetical protein
VYDDGAVAAARRSEEARSLGVEDRRVAVGSVAVG